MKKQKGFTLIELLVVIAIIGILSGVVLSNLNQSRGKGANAAIRSALTQMRTQSNLYLSDYGNFGTIAASGSCNIANTLFADARITQIISSLENAAGGSYTATCANTITNNPSWAISIHLSAAEGINNYICLDSTGMIKLSAGSPGAVTVCPN